MIEQGDHALHKSYTLHLFRWVSTMGSACASHVTVNFLPVLKDDVKCKDGSMDEHYVIAALLNDEVDECYLVWAIRGMLFYP